MAPAPRVQHNIGWAASSRAMAPRKKPSFPTRLPVGWDRPTTPGQSLGTRKIKPGAPASTSCGSAVLDPTAKSSAEPPTSSTDPGLPLQRLASRADAPLALPPAKRSRTAALEAASTAVNKAAALAVYESRTFANSSHGPRDSTWSTWLSFHQRWFGSGPGSTPPLPLTAETVKCVVAMFIAGHYRSTGNYLVRAKDEHTRLGYPWTDVLAREYKRASAAAKRGMGPGHQSHELPLERVLGLDLDPEPDVTEGPYNFKALVVLSCLFLLREIEASLLLARHVVFDHQVLSVTLHLSASKTDPDARTVYRTWRCACAPGRVRACAYHTAWDHFQKLLGKFSVDQLQLPDGFPFFPDGVGNVLEKENVVRAVEELARWLGLPTRTTEGKNAFGGHVFRVSGARHLASLGLELRLIALHARWQSAVVLRYVSEAPLMRLTECYKALLGDAVEAQSGTTSSSSADLKALDDARLSITRQLEELKMQAADLATATSEAAAQREGLRADVAAAVTRIGSLDAQSWPRYLVGTGHRPTGVIHVAASDYRMTSPDDWCTRCGWKYGHSRFQRLPDVPAHTPPELLRHRMCFA